MSAPIHNSDQTPQCCVSSMFQGMVNGLKKLAGLLSQVDCLAQLFFKVKENIQNFFGSFFATATPPADNPTEVVHEVAMDSLRVPTQNPATTELPAEVAKEIPTAPVDRIDPSAVETPPQEAQPDVRPTPTLEERVQDILLGQDAGSIELAIPPEQERPLSQFEKVRAAIDPTFMLNVNSAALPIKISAMEFPEQPIQLSKTAREEVKALHGTIYKNMALFAMSFFPQLNGIENKNFLAKLGDTPYLIEAKLVDKAGRNGITNGGDHLTLHIQKRVLTLYPIQK